METTDGMEEATKQAEEAEAVEGVAQDEPTEVAASADDGAPRSAEASSPESWREERERLLEDIQTLQNRCQKLARALEASRVPKRSVETQTDITGDGPLALAAGTSGAGDGRASSAAERMLRAPGDVDVQLQGIELMFAEQTQVDSLQAASPTALRGCFEAAIAILSNHPLHGILVLKSAQYLSVLLAEPSSEAQLPQALLFQAAQDVVSISSRLLSEETASGSQASQPRAKLLTWLLSLLALLLSAIAQRLREQTPQNETFATRLLRDLVSPLLASAEFANEPSLFKCLELIPLLPSEPWIQKVCLESETVHGLALARQRLPATSKAVSASASGGEAIRAAVRWVFAQNVALCVRAVEDTFVSDAFVCSEVLDALRNMEKQRRGTIVALDEEWGIVDKFLRLWAFHERNALEDANPPKSASRDVLLRIADLLSLVCLKLHPSRLLHRMQEFEGVEILQRIALSTINSSPQLRLQIAVNYTQNGVCEVAIQNVRTLLDRCKEGAPPGSPEAALKLLKDERWPSETWPYILHCLEICLHILSHWSATRASATYRQRDGRDVSAKADVLDASAAPLLLAQGGLVDVLAEIVDPVATGADLVSKPPHTIVQKANETLQALFDKNGHICLFCMQHFKEVRQMIALGCDSLSSDPLVDFPEMQQQAVAQLAESFETFSVQDERLGRKILKTLAFLFESSYRLVAWFLKTHPLSRLTKLQSVDVHIEAVRSVSHAPYWNSADTPLLPDFASLLSQLLLTSTEGLGPDDRITNPERRVLDLTEAEELVAASMSAVLHLLLLDPSPPMVLNCLSASLSQGSGITNGSADKESTASSELAVNALMRLMQLFPSSDRVQLNCQHLLTSLLGE